MSEVLLLLMIVIDMCYFLPIDQQIANEGWLWCQNRLLLSCILQYWCRKKLENELYIIIRMLWKLRHTWQEMTDSILAIEMMINDI